MIRQFLKESSITILVAGILISLSVTSEAPGMADLPNEIMLTGEVLSHENPDMADLLSGNIRSLVPRLLVNEGECEEVSGEIDNRFDLPAARLVNLPANFLKSICSQPLSPLEDKLEDYLEEDAISYTAISSIRYNTAKGAQIYITTLLLSRKAAMLEHRAFGTTIGSDGSQSTRKVILKDNTQAALFSHPTTKNVSNQLTFVRRYQDYMYHITVGSDLPADELIELVSNHLEMQPTKRSR